jgi:hypothetical protein
MHYGSFQRRMRQINEGHACEDRQIRSAEKMLSFKVRIMTPPNDTDARGACKGDLKTE